MDLKGRKIILGVCGSIAAYKSLVLLRLLIKAGAEVQVIMTREAGQFVGKLSFSSLSRNAVLDDLVYDQEWNNHVDLGLWADLMLIAPATAQTISKMSSGMVDNLLTAVYLSAKCPVMVAPAMDLDMWAHPATQKNIDCLRSYGVQLVPVGTGPLASGLSGAGRLAEPEDIMAALHSFFHQIRDLCGKRVLITAGPTFEDIDPVRYIGNNSSGKMGICLAEESAARGAEVILVLGPGISPPPIDPLIRVVRVRSAREMSDAVASEQEGCDYFILAAAVADFQPAEFSPEKIKKTSEIPTLRLVRTPDIAEHLGRTKRPGQLLVGFALETEKAAEHAAAKLDKKNMDMVVINNARETGAGFYVDTNRIDILKKNGEFLSFELKTKREVARDIINEMVNL